MASHLILLGVPRELNIPNIALPSPSSRESTLSRLPFEKLTTYVGRRCADWLRHRREGNSIELLHTRNYVPLKTALHCSWLLLKDEAVAESFLSEYAHYNLDHRLAKLSQEAEALVEALETRLKRGDFDLSRVGDEGQRESLAQRYVEMSKGLRDLRSQKKLLEKAQYLSLGWQTSLAADEVG